MVIANTVKKKRRTPKKMRANDSRQPTFKQAWGSAIGAGLGALVGVAFVRDPKGMTDIIQQMVKVAADPKALEELLKSTIPQAEWSVTGPAPCPANTPGCPGPEAGPDAPIPIRRAKKKKP